MARVKYSPNVCAFLDMISFSEGTQIAGSDDGYDVVVGGKLFKGYESHPGTLIYLPKLDIYSTAAGRYQILSKYARHYIKELGLPDFGPESQDKIAFQLIRECKALNHIINGRIVTAIRLCRSRWASFPGAGYGQREEKIDKLLAYYKVAGGEFHE